MPRQGGRRSPGMWVSDPLTTDESRMRSGRIRQPGPGLAAGMSFFNVMAVLVTAIQAFR
jgi:hypothetical protein